MGLLPPNTKVKQFCFFPKSKHKWIKGDDSGNEDIVEKISEGFVVYRSGRRCSLDIIQEFMDPVSDGPDPSIAEKARRDRLTSGLEVENVDPEKVEEIKAKEKEEIKERKKSELKSQLNSLESEDKKDEPKSPVRLILEANQSNDTKIIPINLPISIPDPSVIDLLKKSFPNSDIESEILDMAINNLTDEDIKKTIRITIENILKNATGLNI